MTSMLREAEYKSDMLTSKQGHSPEQWGWQYARTRPALFRSFDKAYACLINWLEQMAQLNH